jgi:hypothetical protein
VADGGPLRNGHQLLLDILAGKRFIGTTHRDAA